MITRRKMNELLMNRKQSIVAYNRGIGSYTTFDFLETMEAYHMASL